MGSYTIAEWMEVGPTLTRANLLSAVISDRWPESFADTVTPQGAFGWMYGWRWLADDMECSAWTLPEAVFLCLPKCPYEIDRGTEPRWPTDGEARQALTIAAIAWARKERKRLGRKGVTTGIGKATDPDYPK